MELALYAINGDSIEPAVVIPSCRVANHNLDFIFMSGLEVYAIDFVADTSPKGSDQTMSRECSNNRVEAIAYHSNHSVEAFVIHGYRVDRSS
jgi:hypothetical protein|tara:strand:+ start:145 stop:420 length:276 start_codon:yes stop_codon:yes gene_type:complete